MVQGNRWTGRNLSRLEMVASLVLVALVFGTFVERGLRVFAAAEKSAMQAAVLNMNSALRILYYEYVVSGRIGEVAAWQGANPIRLLDESRGALRTGTLTQFPELGRFEAATAGIAGRYRGEVDAEPPPDLQGGDWYFDRSAAALVYRVRNGEFLRSDLPGPPRVRYRLDVRFDDLDGDGQYNPATDRPVDVTLRPLDEFTWGEDEGLTGS